jgi:hypothetical protein
MGVECSAGSSDPTSIDVFFWLFIEGGRISKDDAPGDYTGGYSYSRAWQAALSQWDLPTNDKINELAADGINPNPLAGYASVYEPHYRDTLWAAIREQSGKPRNVAITTRSWTLAELEEYRDVAPALYAAEGAAVIMRWSPELHGELECE